MRWHSLSGVTLRTLPNASGPYKSQQTQRFDSCLFGRRRAITLGVMLPRIQRIQCGRSRSLLGLALVSCLVIGFTRLVRAGQETRGSLATNATVAEQYGRLPLSFEPNEGQSNSPAKFLAHGNGFSIFLARDEADLLLPGKPIRNDRNAKEVAQSAPVNALRMKLIGANSSAGFSGRDELPGKSNYFVGSPDRWCTNIPTYRSVIERSVYPGVDFIYYGNQGQLEYDIVVAPAADPRAVRWSIEGAKKLSIDAKGALVMDFDGGKLRLERPIAYQKVNGSRNAVPVSYALLGDRDVALELGPYDRAQRLVVDPILSYSTYLGGSGVDGANAIAVAPDKTAFIAGGTFSTDFPTNTTLQPNAGGPNDFPKDAFVAKLSVDGSTLIYSTYLGGKNQDVANGIAVDSFGQAYVVGTTISPDYPTTFASFNVECGGDGKCGATLNPGGLMVSNAFVTKLNTEGSGLLYSGFLGEYENVKGLAIAVDANQVAYVTGQTEPNGVPTVAITPPNVPPPPFPISQNAAQTTFGAGVNDAFLTQIDKAGGAILYSTYLGGVNETIGYGVAADTSSNAYVTGITYSSDFPVTGNAFQPLYGGAGDAFLAKVNTAGGPFVYSTFLGSSGLDQGNGITLDSSNNAYVTGETNSGGFVSPRPYGGDGDAFVAKFNTSLAGPGSLTYFTYLGGSLADAGQAIAVDSNGNAYVTGSTVSSDFPVAGAIFQPRFGGGNADAFVTKLDPTGATLLYSSYLGGTNTDVGYGIAVDADGNAYVAGQTCSLDFPLANPVQPASGGNCDAFISKISILNGIQLSPAGLVFSAQSLGTTSQSQTVTLTNGDSQLTISGITVGGPNPGDFNETTTCAASLAPGGTCTITVSFTPGGAGLRKAFISITDSAPGSPQIVALNGQSSTLTLSASSLSFGAQQVDTTSNAVTVTATNNGTTTLTFSSITASGDFAETDDCVKAPLPPSTNCVINVTFTPSASGLSIGALTLTDNAAGSPQVILATGTGTGAGSSSGGTGTASFSIVANQPTPVPSAPAGQPLAFALTVQSLTSTPVPAVTLTCAPPLPAGVSCLVAPNPVIPVPAPGVPVILQINTALRTSVPPLVKRFDGPRDWWLGLETLVVATLFLSLYFALSARTRGLLPSRRALATLGFAVVTALALVGCGSGGSSPGIPAGTPAGNYQIRVVGTAGSTTQSVAVNFQVK